jgi:F0F1-type ATP synthase assembly protein I
MPSERESTARDLYRYSGLGLQFAAVVGLFALAGRWLDGRWNTSPWLLLVGVFLGFGLGLYSMIRKLPSLTRELPAARGEEHPPRR